MERLPSPLCKAFKSISPNTNEPQSPESKKVNLAIEDVLLEAACEEDEGLDFAAFAALARVPSEDLDHFDARLPRPPNHYGDGGGAWATLEPVPEAEG